METAKNKIKRISQKKEKYMFKNKKCSTVWSKECPIFYRNINMDIKELLLKVYCKRKPFL